jgi:hypothetical protein
MALNAPPGQPTPRWSPPGDQVPDNVWVFDTQRNGWTPPDEPVNPDRTQLVMPPGWSPRGRDMPWQVVMSPPGTPAPMGMYNYTPKNREVHQPGAQAPVDETNLSLVPAGGSPSSPAGATAPVPAPSPPGVPPPGGASMAAPPPPAPPGAPSPQRPPAPGMHPGGGAPPPSGMMPPGPNPTPLGTPQVLRPPQQQPPTGMGQDRPVSGMSSQGGAAIPGRTAPAAAPESLDPEMIARALLAQLVGVDATPPSAVGQGQAVGVGAASPPLGALDRNAGVSQNDLQLSPAEAQAACGPAAVLFMNAMGRPPTTDEAQRLRQQAIAAGWTPGAGMGGVGNFQRLARAMGVETTPLPVNHDRIAQAVQAGQPVVVSTPAHYWQLGDYNPDSGKFLTVDAVGRNRELSLPEIQADRYGGPINGVFASPAPGGGQPSAPARGGMRLLGASAADDPRTAILQEAQGRYGDEGARVVNALLSAEGGLGGARGDSGRSAGPFQFYGPGGQLDAYAKAQGVDLQTARDRAAQDPVGAARWAMDNYLGTALQRGLAAGHGGEALLRDVLSVQNPGALESPKHYQRYTTALNSSDNAEGAPAMLGSLSPGWKPTVPGIRQTAGERLSVPSLGQPEGYPAMPRSGVRADVPQGPEVRAPRNVALPKSGRFGEGSFDWGRVDEPTSQDTGQGQGRRVGVGQEGDDPRVEMVNRLRMVVAQQTRVPVEQVQPVIQQGRVVGFRTPNGVVSVAAAASEAARQGALPPEAAQQVAQAGGVEVPQEAAAPEQAAPPQRSGTVGSMAQGLVDAVQNRNLGPPVANAAPEVTGGGPASPAASPAVSPAAAAAQGLRNSDFPDPTSDPSVPGAHGAVPGTNMPMYYGGSSSPVPRGAAAPSSAFDFGAAASQGMQPTTLPNGQQLTGPNGGLLYHDAKGQTVEVGSDGHVLGASDQITPEQIQNAVALQRAVNQGGAEDQLAADQNRADFDRQRALQAAADQAGISVAQYQAQQGLSDEHFPTYLGQQEQLGTLANRQAARAAQQSIDLTNAATRPATVEGMPAYQEGVTGAVNRVPINGPPQETYAPGVRTSTDLNTNQVTVRPGEFPAGVQGRYGGQVLQPQVNPNDTGGYDIPEPITLAPPPTSIDATGRQRRRVMTGPNAGTLEYATDAPRISQPQNIQVSTLPQELYDPATGSRQQIAPGIQGNRVFSLDDSGNVSTQDLPLDTLQQANETYRNREQQLNEAYRNRELDIRQQAQQRPYDEMTKDQAAQIGYNYAQLQQNQSQFQSSLGEKQSEFQQTNALEQQKLGLQQQQFGLDTQKAQNQLEPLPRGGIARVNPFTGSMQMINAPEPEAEQYMGGYFFTPAGRTVNIGGQTVSGGPNPYAAWTPSQAGYGSWASPQMQQQSAMQMSGMQNWRLPQPQMQGWGAPRQQGWGGMQGGGGWGG